MTSRDQLPAVLAEDLAAGLAVSPPDRQVGLAGQSLADGAAGVALLHAERARAGTGSWKTVQAWLAAVTAGGVSAGEDSALYAGVPAVAFVVHAASGSTGRYGDARAALDRAVATVAHRCIDAAHARIKRGDPGRFAEYDVIGGLTGIGAHLLAHLPGDDALGRLLAYLVCLTAPLDVDGEELPGWWCSHDPSLGEAPEFAGGHANLGMAHGVAGPLALLALAARAGAQVDGQTEAIGVLSAFYDRWRQDTPAGPFWPQWITRADLRTGRASQPGPGRPSWCYGTPGIARALQLAALATGDTARQHAAEQALAACLSDPAQLGRLTEAGVCHGWAGLHQTAVRAAADATILTGHLPALTESFLRAVRAGGGRVDGLLEGAAGVALVLHGVAAGTPVTGWDTCLLIH